MTYIAILSTKSHGAFMAKDFAPTNADPTWEKLYGLPSDEIECFAVDPDSSVGRQYALIKDDGVYMRYHRQWTKIYTSANDHLSYMSVDPTNGAIYVSGWDDDPDESGPNCYIYKSTNYGSSWSTIAMISTTPSESSWAYGIASVEARGDVIWTSCGSTLGTGVWQYYRSTDGGTSFIGTASGSGGTYCSVYPTGGSVYIDPNNTSKGYAAINYYLGTGGPVFLSVMETVDGGTGLLNVDKRVASTDTLLQGGGYTPLATLGYGIVNFDKVMRPRLHWIDPVNDNHQRRGCAYNIYCTTSDWDRPTGYQSSFSAGFGTGSADNCVGEITTLPDDTDTIIAARMASSAMLDSINYFGAEGATPFSINVPVQYTALSVNGLYVLTAQDYEHGVYVQGVELSTTSPSGYMGESQFGDRAAFDTKYAPNYHARDILDNVPLFHLPVQRDTDEVPMWDGTKWVAGLPHETTEIVHFKPSTGDVYYYPGTDQGLDDALNDAYCADGDYYFLPRAVFSAETDFCNGYDITVVGRGRFQTIFGNAVYASPGQTFIAIGLDYTTTSANLGFTLSDNAGAGAKTLRLYDSRFRVNMDGDSVYLMNMDDLGTVEAWNCEFEALADSGEILVFEIDKWGGSVAQVYLYNCRVHGTALQITDAIANFHIGGCVFDVGVVPTGTQVDNDDRAPLTHTHDDRYYTETELQTSGSADVHWNNVSNKPINSVLFTAPNPLATGDGDYLICNSSGVTRTITKVKMYVKTAPAGDAIIGDILKGSISSQTTIFTNPANRPTILDGANAGETTDIDVASWGNGEYLIPNVAQTGSTDPGGGLVIEVLYTN